MTEILPISEFHIVLPVVVFFLICFATCFLAAQTYLSKDNTKDYAMILLLLFAVILLLSHISMSYKVAVMQDAMFRAGLSRETSRITERIFVLPKVESRE